MNPPSMIVACASHSDAILAANLAASPAIASGTLALHVERGAPSATVAYNRALAATTAEVVIFAHHDVWLPEGFDRLLARRLAELPADWAVYGTFGVDEDQRNIGPVWSSSLGQIVGMVPLAPRAVQSFDELLIILRRGAGLTWDEALPGWHMYGTDIAQAARAAGRGAYAGALPVIHNDRVHPRLDSDFAEAYRFIQRKWYARLPVKTPIIRVQAGGWHLWRETRLYNATAHHRAHLVVDNTTPPAVLADRCGWLRLD